MKLLFTFLMVLLSTLPANDNYDFDLIKKGLDDNNTLLVVGGIQGDEPGGFISASLLATHYEITKGSVWIVPNLNFYSIIKRSRGPYGDMNRKFAYLSKNDPEYDTIQRIKSYITDDKVRMVVNLHDGSGFYRPKYEDNNHAPHRWGQCSIIDQSQVNIPQYGDLREISKLVVKHVNSKLMKHEHKYHQHNTKTAEGDEEMAKSLTYFAINNGKAAFGNEASKNLPTHERVYYHLAALEKYMDIMGIEYKRKFRFTALGVYKAINDDIYISLYDNKIKLPLDKIRNYLKFFPIKKDRVVDFKASNPLLAIVRDEKKDIYTIQYGNRRLAKLKPDYTEYDKKNSKVKFLVDGEPKDVNFGSIVDVSRDFVVKNNDKFRVNVIGFTNGKRDETEVCIRKNQILSRYSVDKSGNIYRVEYYNKEKFAGMVLVKFRS